VLCDQDLDVLLGRLPEARVGVVGDYCLDVYWMVDMAASEISLETGKATQPVREQRYSLGGAGNVVANLQAMGVGRLSAFGAVGEDPFGERMLALLRGIGVDCTGMVVADDSSAWQTLTYCKPYVGDEELPRIDMGNFNCFSPQLADQLLEGLDQALPELDVVLVNQQVVTGIHTDYLRPRLSALMERHPDSIFVFDGRHYTDSYPHAWLKVNDHEALRRCGKEKDPQELVLREEAVTAAQALYARTSLPVFVTRGARGCVLCTASGIEEVPGLQVIGATDTVGAGDSFLAGAAGALATGASPLEAAGVGNCVARVTVTKLQQTGTASPAEILEVGRVPCFVYEPELAEDPRRARYHDGTSIEIVRDLGGERDIRCAIFDHDGTISTLRQGWEEVMEPMMVRAILGDLYDSADEGLYHRVVGRVRAFIDQTTGVQTLAQMQGLVRIVREMGFVPDEDILDMHGYKAIYNRGLMAMVRQRVARLEKGELNSADFAMKNAIAFLSALHRAGVTLFLASGTDEADVIHEAEAMGHAALFEGRIFGAVGDVSKEAKRLVLERILAEVGDIHGRVVTFGDGPVEVRETHVRGGLAVGVASDEVRRFDLNQSKRSRLIRAGASVIIPDFSQMSQLLDLLGIHVPGAA
jgi:sugar/nucleoside kinase (ribokinase family)/phosphoglycolate phosphatase-like HAD superfamily hydrolase